MKSVIFGILLLGFSLSVQAQFTVSPSAEKVFGKIEEGTIATMVFTIKNNLNVNAEIKEAKPACGCTTAEPSRKVMAPGEESSITVNYDSKNRLGPFEKPVTVVISADKIYTVLLMMKGEVILPEGPKLMIDDNKIDFGTQSVGKELTKKVSIRNMGTKPLVIDAIEYKKRNMISQSITIAPNSAYLWDSKFPAIDKEGLFSDIFTIKSNTVGSKTMYFSIIARVEK